MTTRSRLIIAVGIAATLLAFGATSCSSSDESSDTTASSTSTSLEVGTVPDDEIRIGLQGPLTGDQADVGTGMLQGAQLAAEELNAAGGIDGKTVTIVQIDDQADPDTGVAAATDAIADGLSAVVGPYNSGVGEETLPLYQDAGLVPLRLTSADATEGMGFTLQPMTSQIAPVATTAITEWAQADSVALIYDQTQDYTSDAKDAMTSALDAAGVTITADVAIDPGADSYTDAVTEATADGPELVYVITYYPEAGLIAQAMLESAPDSRCLADYGAYDTGYVEAAGQAAAQNCPVVGVPAPDDFPDSAELVATYADLFGGAPGTWAPYAYDSVMLLASASLEAGGFEQDPLSSALAATSDWSGWTGSVAFDAPTGNREPAPVVVLSTRDDGTLHLDDSWSTATGFEF
jgi:branched-chain amino acid transport system substrate-binding protein